MKKIYCPHCGSSNFKGVVNRPAMFSIVEGEYVLKKEGKKEVFEIMACAECKAQITENDLVEFIGVPCTKCGDSYKEEELKDGLCPVCIALENRADLANASPKDLIRMLLKLEQEKNATTSKQNEEKIKKVEEKIKKTEEKKDKEVIEKEEKPKKKAKKKTAKKKEEKIEEPIDMLEEEVVEEEVVEEEVVEEVVEEEVIEEEVIEEIEEREIEEDIVEEDIVEEDIVEEDIVEENVNEAPAFGLPDLDEDDNIIEPPFEEIDEVF